MWRRLAKSTSTIIGKTIAQMSTATTRLTEATSSPARKPNTPGISVPSAMPAAMQSATQTESHFSKKPMEGAANLGAG